MRCPEPGGQRQLGPVENGPGSDRCLASAAQAFEAVGPRAQAGSATAPASRADKAGRPAIPDEKLGAGGLVGEFGLELGQRTGSGHATSILPPVRKCESTYGRPECLPGTPGEAFTVPLRRTGRSRKINDVAIFDPPNC